MIKKITLYRQNFEAVLNRFGSALLLPVAAIALAELILVIAQFFSWSYPATAAVITALGQGLMEWAPVLVSGVIALEYCAGEQGWAVLAATGSAAIWQISALALLRWLGVIWPGGNALFGWFTGLAAVYITVFLFKRWPGRLQKWTLLSGRRSAVFVNLATALPLGVLSGWLWYYLAANLARLADWLALRSDGRMFLYGFFGRLLRPLNLDSILDRVILHEAGSFTTLPGELIKGDLNRFLAGDSGAGYFAAGGFAVKVFIIPVALLLLFFVKSRSEKNKGVFLIWLFAALTTMVGGYSLAADFLILIVSPVTYLFTALFSGLAYLISGQLQIRLGYLNAPGLVEYIVNWRAGENPGYVLLTGAVLVVPIAVFIYYYFGLFKKKGKEDAKK